jgi:hypothetical protein
MAGHTMIKNVRGRTINGTRPWQAGNRRPFGLTQDCPSRKREAGLPQTKARLFSVVTVV